jgi:hypothetical protein
MDFADAKGEVFPANLLEKPLGDILFIAEGDTAVFSKGRLFAAFTSIIMSLR